MQAARPSVGPMLDQARAASFEARKTLMPAFRAMVQDQLAQSFGAEFGTVGDALKYDKDAFVFEGVFRGEPAIFKVLLTDLDHARRVIIQARDELTYLDTALGEGAYRAVRCLAIHDDPPVIIQSHAPGQPVSLITRNMSAQERAPLAKTCAEWLTCVSDLRRSTRSFRPFKYLKRLDAMTPHSDPEFEALAGTARKSLWPVSEPMRRKHILYAKAHGDFCADNLNFDGTTLWAYDIQGAPFLALSRTIAQFLVTYDLPNPPSDQMRLGLDVATLQAFDPSQMLGADEVQHALRFFIGEQLIRRTRARQLKNHDLDRAVLRLRAYVRDVAGNEG